MRKAFLSKTPEKILIIRLSSIGDVLLTTPVIRLLRKKFPGSKIDFVVKKQFAPVLADHPQVDRLYIFDKHAESSSLRALKKEIRQQQYDLIVDLHNNIRSKFLAIGSHAKMILCYRKGIIPRLLYVKFKLKLSKQIVPAYQKYINSLKIYGIKDDYQGLDFYVHPEVERQVRQKYRDFWQEDKHSIIGIVPGAQHPTKRWTSEGFSSVINYLVEKGKYQIILFGNQHDRNIAATFDIPASPKILNSIGELSLREAGALMNCCDLVITNDSGLMHLATALKKKVIAIFGSTTEELGFFPYLTEHIVIQNNSLTCRPCSHIGRKKCPKRHFKCMKDISAQHVIDAIETILAKT